MPAVRTLVRIGANPFHAALQKNGFSSLRQDGDLIVAPVANGGSLDEISKGVDFFKDLKAKGNFNKVQASTATVKNGTTPVVFDWDYLQAGNVKNVPTWKVYLPENATLGGYYAQAINADAPHPAAARLWEEYLYSDEGQNLWLKGGARPVRMDAMTKGGTIDAAAAAALPAVSGTPQFPTQDQLTKAKTVLATSWAKAIS